MSELPTLLETQNSSFLLVHIESLKVPLGPLGNRSHACNCKHELWGEPVTSPFPYLVIYAADFIKGRL